MIDGINHSSLAYVDGHTSHIGSSLYNEIMWCAHLVMGRRAGSNEVLSPLIGCHGRRNLLGLHSPTNRTLVLNFPTT